MGRGVCKGVSWLAAAAISVILPWGQRYEIRLLAHCRPEVCQCDSDSSTDLLIHHCDVRARTAAVQCVRGFREQVSARLLPKGTRDRVRTPNRDNTTVHRTKCKKEILGPRLELGTFCAPEAAGEGDMLDRRDNQLHHPSQ